MTSAIPDTQKAWVNVTKGAPSKALEFRQDWTTPKKLKPGEVLVQIQAAALNPVGYKLFKLLPNFVANRPRVTEFDLSGIVVDANGSRFSDGDNVFGWIPSNSFRTHKQGTLAQYASVPADALVLRPSTVTPTEASGLALAGLTAYTAIIKNADIQPGQKIFINGGSTAVGAFAIQLAKIRGAVVTASASARNELYVRKMGADEFVDYTKESLPQYLTAKGVDKKFDYILEAVGIVDPSIYVCSDSYLSPMGAYLSVGPQPKNLSASELFNLVKTIKAMITPRFLGGNKARFVHMLVVNEQKDLEQFQEYVAQGTLKPIVDSVFDFDKALEAYDRLMSGRATGKVVIKIDPAVD